MNAKRMGMLASLAFTIALLGGMIASASSTCVPSGGSGIAGSGCTFTPISENPYFIQTYQGTQSNLIFSSGALSDLGTWLVANLGTLIVLGIAIGILQAVGFWAWIFKKL